MDIDAIRRETPGVSHRIHFNNAGASMIPNPVHQAVLGYLDYEQKNGGYETAEYFAEELGDFYTHLAHMINADPEELGYMESATIAWDMAFFSIPFSSGDKILTSEVEYASNYIAYLQIQKRLGVKVIPVNSLPTGETDPEAVEAEVRKGNVKLISITHIPTNGGLVNPAESIGTIAEEHGVLYLLDACQSAGQYPLDVKKLKCHFLSATGRKYMRGPRGTGFLYASRKILEDFEPFSLDLHSAEWVENDKYVIRKDAKRFEKWESNLAAKHGLSVAAKYASTLGLNNIWARVRLLAGHLRDQLSSLPGIEVLDIGQLKSGIVTFRHETIPAPELKERLFLEGVNVSRTFESGTLLDNRKRGITTSVRSSVHYYNTEQEIDSFISILRTIISS